MFLGGVTRRFSGLNMAFLEGGAGWACLLYGDLLGHWEKRSLKGLKEVDPRNIDSGVLLDLAEKYGGEAFTAALKRQDDQFFPGEEKLTGGIAGDFRHFVTSMPAPVASGGSDRRVGLAPTGKRRLVMAHAESGHSPAL